MKEKIDTPTCALMKVLNLFGEQGKSMASKISEREGSLEKRLNSIEQVSELNKILGHKYRNITPLVTPNGAMSELFLASFGEGEENRVIKIDKPYEELREGKPKEYRNRGCDRKNAFRVLSKLEEAENHNITAVYDYETTKDGSVITVEKNLKGFQTLYDFVKQNGPLSKRDTKEIFSRVFDAAKYISEKEVFHRDYSPHNILVRKGSKGWEVEVNDFGNAIEKGKVKAKFLPTAGNSAISDPFMYSPFVGEEREYSDKAEVFSLGINEYFAITGKLPFFINPDEGVLKSNITLENLLNGNGQIDKEKYNTELEKALKLVPKKQRDWFRKSLTSPEDRFESVEKQAEAFDYINRPSFWSRLKKDWYLALGFSALLGLAGAGTVFNSYANQKEKQRLEQLAEENSKYLVQPKWDGGEIEIRNNAVNLELCLRTESNGKTDWDNIYPNKVKFLRANQGDNIWGNITLRDGPLPEKVHTPRIKIKAYFEGYEGAEETSISPFVYDQSTQYDFAGHGLGTNSVRVEIPKEMSEGIHTLIFEGYAPERDSSLVEKEKIRFKEPGQVILQKRVPIIVGNPKTLLNLDQLRMGCSDHIYFENLNGKEVRKGEEFNFEASICGQNKSDSRTKIEINYLHGAGTYFSLPGERKIGKEIMQAVLKDKEGKIICFDYIPIKSESWGGTASWYAPTIPPEDFHEKTVKYRKELFKDQSK